MFSSFVSGKAETEAAEHTLNVTQPSLPGAVGLSPEGFKLVFGNLPSFLRTLQFLSVLARVAGNTAFISYNFQASATQGPR